MNMSPEVMIKEIHSQIFKKDEGILMMETKRNLWRNVKNEAEGFQMVSKEEMAELIEGSVYTEYFGSFIQHANMAVLSGYPLMQQNFNHGNSVSLGKLDTEKPLWVLKLFLFREQKNYAVVCNKRELGWLFQELSLELVNRQFKHETYSERPSASQALDWVRSGKVSYGGAGGIH